MTCDLTVLSTPDLVKILHGIQSREKRTQHHMPLRVDEKIHCRLLKLVYIITYAKYNTPLFLNRTPQRYEVWHPYRYCVTCRHRFFPLSIYFWYGKLSSVRLFPLSQN